MDRFSVRLKLNRWGSRGVNAAAAGYTAGSVDHSEKIEYPTAAAPDSTGSSLKTVTATRSEDNVHSQYVLTSGLYGREPSRREVTDRITQSEQFEATTEFKSDVSTTLHDGDHHHKSNSKNWEKENSNQQTVNKVAINRGKVSSSRSVVFNELEMSTHYSTYTSTPPTGTPLTGTAHGAHLRVFHSTTLDDGPAKGFELTVGYNYDSMVQLIRPDGTSSHWQFYSNSTFFPEGGSSQPNPNLTSSDDDSYNPNSRRQDGEGGGDERTNATWWGGDEIFVEFDLDGKAYVYLDDVGFWGGNTITYLGMLDEATGFVQLVNGSWTTLGQLQNFATRWESFDAFLASDKYSTKGNPATSGTDNYASNGRLAGGRMINLLQMAQAEGRLLTPADFDKTVNGAAKARELANELLTFYATAPLEFAQIASTAQKVYSAQSVAVKSLSVLDKSQVRFARNVASWLKCFSRDTLVSTKTGLKPIGTIQEDEEVYSFDFDSDQWVLCRVIERLDNFYEGPVVTISTGDGTIETTVYHPFWVCEGRDLDERQRPRELAVDEDEGLSLEGRWVNSHELRVGDVVFDRSGNRVTIQKIEQRYEEKFPVSNLTIERLHNFSVGTRGILVHNTAICETAIQAVKSGHVSVDDFVKNAIKVGHSLDEINAALKAAGQASKLIEPIIDSAKFSSKVRSKLNQLRKKYPDIRRGVDGAADAQKLAEEAFKRGNVRVGPAVGQGADSALYFDDGPVTWVFKLDGTFWSMRVNNGWKP